MKTWKAFAQINGDCVSYYPEIEFKVTEKLYKQIMRAIENEKPLCECSFYAELIKRADKELEKSLPDILDFESLYEKPDPDWYDMTDRDEKEAYKEALEEYNSHLEDIWQDFSLDSFELLDPNIEVAFKKHFVGRDFPNCVDDDVDEDFSLDFDLDNDENCQHFSVTVSFDAKGTIKDVEITESCGMESDDVRSSSWDDCMPDYDFITDALEEELDNY